MKKPWETEPDEVRFEHAGLRCVILRNEPSKALCGYVGIGVDHPLYKIEYEELHAEFSVHGGLTYSYTYLPHEHPSDDTWWIGFDCSHAGDFLPIDVIGINRIPGSMYRDMDYVRAITESLAEQLAMYPYHRIMT